MPFGPVRSGNYAAALVNHPCEARFEIRWQGNRAAWHRRGVRGLWLPGRRSPCNFPGCSLLVDSLRRGWPDWRWVCAYEEDESMRDPLRGRSFGGLQAFCC